MRDSDVREAVRARLSVQHAGDPHTRIVEEMGVWSGSVRIDIAVINGELCGFELKSDRDTLDRLPFQAELYSRVFDRVNLVVGKRHATKAAGLVPDWWGITVAIQEQSHISLHDERSPSHNPGQEPYLIAQLLWKSEALAVLESHGAARGWRAKRIKAIHEHLASALPLQDLKDHVREALKRRADWLGQDRPDQLDVPVNA